MTPKTVFYTRAGDDGSTTIYGQTTRIPKYHPRPEAYGSIDEAQAMLGVIRAGKSQVRTKEILVRVERDLYFMMSHLAVAKNITLSVRAIDQTDVDWLEKTTGALGKITGPFTGFVLPGDTLTGARIQQARTIVRRAERRVAQLYHTEELDNPFVLKYLNRLSSLLFVLALVEDQQGGVTRPTFAKDIQD